MAQFSKGDIVSLRSGSPPLIVSETPGTSSVVVTFWNPVTGRVERDTVFEWVLRAGATTPTAPGAQR